MEQRKEDGTLLYKTLLNKVHNGDINEMYEYLLKSNKNIVMYGDTIEKRLINYCTFKRELVIILYYISKEKEIKT